ncbi:MAG: transcriptional repressor [Streptomyces sp.]|uniref:Fur family transcriptional regulator n=1 Tax=Streptomyces sp. TaxID=1931 RepID=UPI000A5BDB3E|nr:Fur family transcriptional regulator [Streptomyces sp.]MBW8792389.1 transcriptional repressor [Streptomyces sp.]
MSGHLHADDTEPASAESKEQTRFAKRTRQRRAVTGALAEQPGFVSAQALHAQLQAAGHQVGLSTVYRTLHALAEAGSVDTVRGEGGEELFRRRRTPGHHHYLVCRRCGFDVPVSSPTIEDWADHVAAGHGFSQVQHTIELVGLCADCTRDTT